MRLKLYCRMGWRAFLRHWKGHRIKALAETALVAGLSLLPLRLLVPHEEAENEVNYVLSFLIAVAVWLVIQILWFCFRSPFRARRTHSRRTLGELRAALGIAAVERAHRKMLGKQADESTDGMTVLLQRQRIKNTELSQHLKDFLKQGKNDKDLLYKTVQELVETQRQNERLAEIVATRLASTKHRLNEWALAFSRMARRGSMDSEPVLEAIQNCAADLATAMSDYEGDAFQRMVAPQLTHIFDGGKDRIIAQTRDLLPLVAFLRTKVDRITNDDLRPGFQGFDAPAGDDLDTAPALGAAVVPDSAEGSESPGDQPEPDR